jgi:hypothetical protein
MYILYTYIKRFTLKFAHTAMVAEAPTPCNRQAADLESWWLSSSLSPEGWVVRQGNFHFLSLSSLWVFN